MPVKCRRRVRVRNTTLLNQKVEVAVALETYRKKRKFDVTLRAARAQGGAAAATAMSFKSTPRRRLHYDLRLELDGVMKSWAVTRGPSLDPNEKRLAVHVEDHPIEYNTFEGTIPEGEYGGGTVMIWDRGTWAPDGDPHKGYAKGHLVFDLDGEKLHGRWHLVRMRGAPRRPPRQLAADQRQGRSSARRARQRHSGRGAASVGDRPLDRGDRRRQGQEAGLALQSRERRPAAETEARQTQAARASNRRSRRSARECARAGARTRKAKTAKAATKAQRRSPRQNAHARTKSAATKSNARAARYRAKAKPRARLPAFVPLEPRHAATTARRAGRIGCTRSSSTATASRRGSTTAMCSC